MPGGGQFLTISGQTCRVNGVAITGMCAAGASLEHAREAATVAMLNVLAAVAAACQGSLPAHLHVCRLRGFVRCSPEFQAHTAVLDAASLLLAIAWPDAPKPARTAVGVPSLPDSAVIEIELDAILAGS
jgi:enamine deaminase RidA (YjgF/YER057c/UK114 family)